VNAGKVLALLCAGSTKYHAVGGRATGGDSLSKAELAGLLADLSPAAMNLALAKYMLDEEAERLLIAHVRVAVVGWAAAEKWHIVNGRPCVLNMSALAVIEVVRPNRCGKCGGTSVVAGKVCCGCGGLGYARLSNAVVANAIGYDKSTFGRVWKERYLRVIGYVQDIDSNVEKIIYGNGKEKVVATCNDMVV
jgi:hypothetical protein